MNATEKPPTGTLRTRVFDVLVARGTTQAWLARQLGLSQSMIVHIKNGRRRITPEFAEGCVRALGLPYDVLFYVAPSPSRDFPWRESNGDGEVA